MDTPNGQEGHRVGGMGACLRRPREKTMDQATLCNLLDSFTDEKRRLETTALLTDDPSRRVAIEQRAHAIAIIVTDLRGEVYARDSASGRSTNSAAPEFETHLHRVLKAHGSMESAHGARMRRTA